MWVVINALAVDIYTGKHIHTLWTKAISRNQVCSALWPFDIESMQPIYYQYKMQDF